MRGLFALEQNMANLMPLPKMRFTNAGRPLVGGKVFFYVAGTTTPKTTFKDRSQATANTNPVILDSNGEADIWLEAGYYKVVLKTSSDATVWTQDYVSAPVIGTDEEIYNELITILQGAISGSVNTFYAPTKATADALAATLGNGATVVTDEDEAGDPIGVQTRRTVIGGVLSAIVSFLKTGMIAWKHGGASSVWRTLYARLMDLPVSVKDFGAKGDGTTLANGAISAASSTFASATAGFTAADVGKVITIYGAGAAGVSLTTTISAFVSSTQVTIATPASTTVSGATFHYGTDDTAAFNLALAYLAANRINARGLGRIGLGRGRFLCNGTISSASTLTLIFEGQGAEATQIIRTVDTGNLFNFSTYIYLEFRDLGIYHVTATDRSKWTTRSFNLSGSGGGREFCLRRVETSKFDRITSFSSNVNEDTNYFEGCTFSNFKTFLYCRNSQALINSAVQCTWFGYADRVFDISGFGYTHIDTANVVTSGTFLYLANGNSGDASQYLMQNVKLEFWNGPNNNNTNGTTKILEMEDSASNAAYIKFEKCGIAGGTPDPSIYQWDIKGGSYTIDVDGGQWAGTNVQTKGRTSKGGHNAWRIVFKNLTNAPSTTINRLAGPSGAHHVPVVFDSCIGVSNILLRGSGSGLSGGNGKVSGFGNSKNFNSTNSNGYIAGFNNTLTHSFSSYGQWTLVDRIRVVATLAFGWTGAEIKAFSDAALTVQIGATLTPAGGSFSTPQVFEIAVPAGTFTNDGVYVTVKNTNAGGAAEGLVFVDTLST